VRHNGAQSHLNFIVTCPYAPLYILSGSVGLYAPGAGFLSVSEGTLQRNFRDWGGLQGLVSAVPAPAL
jgi:hypothetical protein